MARMILSLLFCVSCIHYGRITFSHCYYWEIFVVGRWRGVQGRGQGQGLLSSLGEKRHRRPWMIPARAGGNGSDSGSGLPSGMGDDDVIEGNTKDETVDKQLYDEEEEEVGLDHPSVPLPYIEPGSPREGEGGVGLILMDPFSPFHGQYLSRMAREVYGAGVVTVFSGYMAAGFYHEQEEHGDDDDNDNVENDELSYLRMRAPDRGKEHEWVSRVPFEVIGVICESDSGLPCAERLAAALLPVDRHNGYDPARRNKAAMARRFLAHTDDEKDGSRPRSRFGVRVRVPRQTMCATVEEALEFADDVVSGTETVAAAGVVLKPTRGVGSENVFLCRRFVSNDDNNADTTATTNYHDSVRKAFHTIYGSNVFGSGGTQRHRAVLVQEFVDGTEYAIDTVSRDGSHKVAAVWRYDKRPANGAPFVYHGTILDDGPDATAAALCATEALDALGVRWGLAHVEVIVLPKLSAVDVDIHDDLERCRLIEVNCRQHNTDFCPITTTCLGYNALDMLLCAYLGTQEEWEETYPPLPTVHFPGAVVHLVSHVEGRLLRVHLGPLGGDTPTAQSVESVRQHEIYPTFSEPGAHIYKTVDIKTDAGWVHLMNDDTETFQRDYDTIVEHMPHMFQVEDTNQNQNKQE